MRLRSGRLPFGLVVAGRCFRHCSDGRLSTARLALSLIRFSLIARRWILLHRQDVAGFGRAVEMQLDTAGVELTHHLLDALLDRRMVRAVASDEFLDNGPQRRGR